MSTIYWVQCYTQMIVLFTAMYLPSYDLSYFQHFKICHKVIIIWDFYTFLYQNTCLCILWARRACIFNHLIKICIKISTKSDWFRWKTRQSRIHRYFYGSSENARYPYSCEISFRKIKIYGIVGPLSLSTGIKRDILSKENLGILQPGKCIRVI